MLTIRPASERGGGNHGWLNTKHTFSFADYYDPAHVHFRALRVMNEDWIAPGQGFGTHGHKDMEIITYVLAGALEHKDSLGHGEVLRPGEVQRMSAGTGVRHSEFNPQPDQLAHLYQIWLVPDRPGHEPGYAQKAFPAAHRRGRWQTVISPNGRDGSLSIHQDATIALADIGAGQTVSHDFASGRYGWLQVLRGEVQVGRHTLAAGDGLAISDEASVTLTGMGQAEVMLFDLA